MTTYKGIKGFNIQTVSSDPPAPFTGQVWYNSTSATVKYFAVQSAAWATGGALNTARGYITGCGTQTAALGIGGESPKTAVEEYNGTSWTAKTAKSNSNYIGAACGTTSAALFFGGATTPPFSPSNLTEEYNGSSWTFGS